MKVKHALMAIVLGLFTVNLSAQFSVAWRAEVQDNYYSINDPGAHLQNTIAKTVATGFDISYTYKNWLLSSGICNKAFHSKITFANLNVITPNLQAIQVPILVGRKFNFFKNKLNICPLVGTNFFYLPSAGTFARDFFVVTDSVIFLVNRSTVALEKTAFSLAGMLQVNFQITKHFSVGTYVAYSKGFKTIVQQQVSYSSGLSPVTNAGKSDNATFFSRWALRMQYSL